MQHGAVFGDVDFAAAEQLAHLRAKAARARELGQKMHGVLVDQVLRVIEQHAADTQRKMCKALRLGIEQLRNARQRHGLPVRLKRLPGGGFGQRVHFEMLSVFETIVATLVGAAQPV